MLRLHSFRHRPLGSSVRKSIRVVARESRKTLERQLAFLLLKQSTIEYALADVRKAQSVITESSEVISAKVSSSYDRVIRAVEEKKKSEPCLIRNVAEDKLNVTAAHETRLTAILDEVKVIESSVQGAVQCKGDVDFMVLKKGMILTMNEMLQRMNSLPKELPETKLLACVVVGELGEAVSQMCEQLMRPYTLIDMSQCRVVVTGCEHVQVGSVVSAEVYLNDSEGLPCPLQQCVTVELRGPRFGGIATADAVVFHSSHYEASCIPTLCTRGHCKLIIKINGHLMEGGPIQMFVHCPPQLLGEPVHVISGADGPVCLKIFNELMFCMFQSGIFVINLKNISAPPTPTGMFPNIKRFQKWVLTEMAIDKKVSVLYITDRRNNMVHKFKLNGQYIKSIGQKGSDVCKFNFVNGLCVQDGLVYICDSNNHRVQVFDRNLCYCSCFCSYGSAPGQFNWPDNIAFDSAGCLFVTDHNNHRVQCLTTCGTPISCFGCNGTEPGQFHSPNVIEVTDDYLFVTDVLGVSVFTTSGEFITRFAAICGYSNGLAIDKHGFVFVSDRSQDRIVVF